MPSGDATAMDGEFLGIRCRLIELAAALDRLDRAGASDSSDVRRSQIRRALEILSSHTPEHAEQVQLVFSLPYQGG
ncbi:MAG: hypothetical protein LLF97_10490 [Planctomycetaceae bacterium]|nr:hypothetical protein [Planctomycetaceae bacterium]